MPWFFWFWPPRHRGAETEDPWRLDTSLTATVDHHVAMILTGAASAAVKVGSTDLDQDGFPEFFVFSGGEAKLLRLGKEKWTDISGGSLDGVGLPTDITLRDEWFNGFQIFRASGELRAFRDGVFVRRGEMAAAALDASRFSPACLASPGLGGAEEGETPPADGPDYCACLVEEWGARDADQALFDAWTQAIVDRSKLDLGEAEYDRFDLLIGEAQQSCDQRFGRDDGVTQPSTTPFDGSLMPVGAGPFIETCAAQDFVIANRKVGTADRALGLCACMAAQMSVDGLHSGVFDLATALYSGDMSQEEVAEADPLAVEKSDAAAAECFKRLPVK
ncbi:MAG: hypothetical protein IPL47_06060 [Phyllobacteriaceae bacterium]|nr:hypothetical protein [Phyllobacteriaceae bacterium]